MLAPSWTVIPLRQDYAEVVIRFAEVRGIKVESCIEQIFADWINTTVRAYVDHEMQEHNIPDNLITMPLRA